MLYVILRSPWTNVGTVPIGFMLRKVGFLCYSLNRSMLTYLQGIFPISSRALTARLGWLTTFQYKIGFYDIIIIALQAKLIN